MNEIKDLFELNIKPKRIHEIMFQKGFKFKKTQIDYYLAKLRKIKYGRSTISLNELDTWCREHSSIPEDKDESFVVNYCTNALEIDIENEDMPCFNVIISTKRLLEKTFSKHIHADSTYKLVWEGMPVIIIGTTDMDRHFHPICISI